MFIEKHFWDKVSKAGNQDCWLWTGAVSPGGYGLMTVDGEKRPVHRISYELIAKRPLPKGSHIDHRCGNRRCVNWDHLELTTKPNYQRTET